MKKICSLLLAFTLLTISFSLYGCSKKISEDEAIGSWISTKSVYLDAYGCDCENVIIIKSSGSYVTGLKKADTGKAIDGTLKIGSWDIDDEGNLCLQAYGEVSWSTWKYNGKTLKNGKWTLEKVE